MKILFFTLCNKDKIHNNIEIDKQDLFSIAILDEKRNILKSSTNTIEFFEKTLEDFLSFGVNKSVTGTIFEKDNLMNFINKDSSLKFLDNSLCLKELLFDSTECLRSFKDISLETLLKGFDIDYDEKDNQFNYLYKIINIYFAYFCNEIFNEDILKDLPKNTPLIKENSIQKSALNSIYIDFEFDIEDRQRAELISIGAVVTKDGYNIIDSFYSIIKTVNKKSLSKTCMDITHISQEEVDNADNLKNVMNKFYHFIDKYLRNGIIYNWGNFDKVALSKILRGNELGNIYNKIFRDMYDIQIEISNNIKIKDEPVSKCIGLEKMKEMYGLSGEVKHNALEDSKDLMKVVYSYRKYNYDTSIVRNMYKEKIRKTFLWNYNFVNKNYSISYDIVCFIKSLKVNIPIDEIKKSYKKIHFKLIKDIPLQFVIVFMGESTDKEYVIVLDADQKEILKSFIKIELPELIDQQIVF